MLKDEHRSPFRYPGGKASLAKLLGDVIELNFGTAGTYCEPFAGGAGAATLLLGQGRIESLHLNDADPRVFHAWETMLRQTDRFLERLDTVPLTMNEWWRHKEVIEDIRSHDAFDIGFATFYLNRTNRSGILQKAGPIGGYAQEGKWGIDARFNRVGLRKRIEFLSKKSDCISLSNLDAIEFLKKPNFDLGSTFFFVDPPYVVAGSRLYYNSMDEEKHRKLSEILEASPFSWLLTYDDHDLIRQLYTSYAVDSLPIRYALQRKRLESEVLIKSADIRLPAEAA